MTDRHGAEDGDQFDYRQLFETMLEGVTLCEAIRNADGLLVDYRFLQANPAFLRGFNLGPEIIGRRLTELRPEAGAGWFANFQSTIDTGKSNRFQYRDRALHRWYSLHCTRVSADRFAIFYIDVTAMKRAEEHKAVLLDELNHRVKNNLAIIASMLELQARGAPREVAEHLEAAVSRVHAIADLHADLYRRSDHEHVAMDRYLQDLVPRLSRSLVGDRIKLTVEAAPLAVKLEQAVQLGLVVNELVTNAVKHAFPDPDRQGQVTICLEARGEVLRLVVSDDGVGLPPAESRPRGLGRRMVEAFVQQCGGVLTTTTSHDGARFEVEIPWRSPDAPPPEAAKLL